MPPKRTATSDLIIPDSISDIELCHRLKKSTRAVASYRAKGLIPYYICLGKIRYKLEDVEQFQKATQ